MNSPSMSSAGRADGVPLRPEIAGAPLLRDVAERLDVTVQIPAVRAPLERIEEVAARNLTEVLEHRVLVGNGCGHAETLAAQSCAVRPRKSGAMSSSTNARTRSGAPRRSTTRAAPPRVPDHGERLVQSGDSSGEVGHEQLRRRLPVDRRPCPPRRTCRLAVFAQPRHVPRPRSGTTHEPVQEQYGPPRPTLVVQHGSDGSRTAGDSGRTAWARSTLASMAVVKINAIEVPEGAGPELGSGSRTARTLWDTPRIPRVQLLRRSRARAATSW